MSALASFRADPEYAAFRDVVRRFVAQEVMPHQAAWEANRYADRDVWLKSGSLGMLLPDIPEVFGGGGGSAVHAAVLPEELALAGDSCLGGVVVQGAVARYLLNHGTRDQKERYLPQLASGASIAAIAITEPDAGSDIQAIGTTFKSWSDGFVLSGSKRFVTNGHLADLFLVAAKTRASDRISLLLVERGTVTGVQCGPIPDMIGLRGHDVCDVFFDDVRLSQDAILGGASGRGFSQLMRELPYERVLIGVIAAAAIERTVSLAVEHTKTRKLFGKRLFDIQDARFRLARARTHATVARSFVDRCLTQLEQGVLDAEAAAMAKWFLTDLECRTVDECLQLFGGDGQMTEQPMAHMYLNARVRRIYGGANELMLEVIAQAL